MSDSYIPAEDWETIVPNVPIVSVDLVVLHDGGVVLGKRTNEPVKEEWFVPGGRVHKHERLRDAVHRIAKEELDIDVEILESMGAYEHFYKTSDIGDSGKHYLANGFVVQPASKQAINDEEQHERVRVFNPNKYYHELHQYVRQYLSDSKSINYKLEE